MNGISAVLLVTRPQLALQAMRSIAEQLDPPDELVVVDGSDSGWTQGGWIAAWAGAGGPTRTTVRLVRSVGPPGPKIVAGAKLADGALLAYLDDDDLWERTKLLHLGWHLPKDHRHQMGFINSRHTAFRDGSRRTRASPVPEPFAREDLSAATPVPVEYVDVDDCHQDHDHLLASPIDSCLRAAPFDPSLRADFLSYAPQNSSSILISRASVLRFAASAPDWSADSFLVACAMLDDAPAYLELEPLTRVRNHHSQSRSTGGFGSFKALYRLRTERYAVALEQLAQLSSADSTASRIWSARAAEFREILRTWDRTPFARLGFYLAERSRAFSWQ